MSRVTRSFSFNTAISGIDPATGKFDDDSHRTLVLPLRGRVMQVDGMVGCQIGRYDMEVSYLDDVTDNETVVASVISAVNWAATEGEGFFPLRGSKMPVATYVAPTPRTPSHNVRVTITFDSYLVRYHPGSADGWDEAAFRESVRSLVERMTRLSGVLHHEIRPGSASIKVDTRYITVDAVEEHLRTVFLEAASSSGDDFFPFVADGATPGFKITRRED